jgi:hypothetical protein
VNLQRHWLAAQDVLTVCLIGEGMMLMEFMKISVISERAGIDEVSTFKQASTPKSR